MRKRIILMVTLSLSYGEDEFFQPTKSIGGYGELHYNHSAKEGSDPTKVLDFHRFIIYYAASLTEKWAFFSEVELEHNFVSDGEGELELEQAFVEYRGEKGGLKGGVILPSVGLINEYHEPPLFLSVERPEYSKYVIPTTWFANGVSVNYRPMDGLRLRFAMIEDLNGEGIGSGIRSGRGKGYKTTAYDWTKNISAAYTGVPGLRVGGSYTMNNAPINSDPDTTINIALMELHAKYDANNIHAVFECGNIQYDGTNHTPAHGSSGGYYADLGYNIGSLFGLSGRLMPWVRYSDYNRGTDPEGVVPTKHFTITRLGLTYWPIGQVALKLDYGTKVTEDPETVNITQLNIGIGYNF